MQGPMLESETSSSVKFVHHAYIDIFTDIYVRVCIFGMQRSRFCHTYMLRFYDSHYITLLNM